MVECWALKKAWLWLRPRISSPYILKKWLRATFTLVATLVFIVNPSTSQIIGQAGIYAAALAVALPPVRPVSVHIYMIFVLLFCLTLSWVWSCLSTAIAFAARNKTLLQKQFQLAEAWTASGFPSVVNEYFPVESGIFLDIRSSAVFGICFFLGSFAFALWLGHMPQLTLPLFFGQTLMVLLFSVNPLLPYASYLSARNFLIGAAFYSAISTATLLFIFPESYNHTWLGRIRRDILLPTIEFLEQEAEQSLRPDLDSIINTYEMEGELFETEFSIHRLTPLEFNVLFKHIKSLVDTVITLEACQRRMHVIASHTTLIETTADREDASLKIVRLCRNLRLACRISLLDVDEWLRECSSDSWADTFSPVDTQKIEYRRQRLDISRSNLLHAKIKFKNEEICDIISLERLLGSIQDQQTIASTHREWLNSSTFADAMESLSTNTASLLSFLIEIEDRHPKPVPRFPCLFKSILRSPKRHPSDIPPSFPVLPLAPPLKEKKSQIIDQAALADDTSNNPLPSPFSGTNTRKRPRLFEWLALPQTIYAFRVAFLSTTMYSLGLCKTTASVYFSYGGFVSTILAQSYVEIYAGDQIFFFVVRLFATMEALLFALGGWLSTAGEGPVNPYAFIVMATMTCLCPLLITVSSSKRSHILFGIIFSTTVVTTLVFTWGEVKLNTAPPLQIVFKNIWARALIDAIGFVASAIVMMIPFLHTSRRGFHDRLSASLIELSGYLQCYWMEDATSSAILLEDSRAEVIFSMMRKQDKMEHFLETMKFDPCIRGLSSSLYRQIFHAQKRLLFATITYLEALGRLDTSVRLNLSVHVACVKPDVFERFKDRVGLLIERNQELQRSQILRDDIQGTEHLDTLYSLDGLDSNIPVNQMLALSSAMVNFAAMVKEIDELFLLISDKKENTTI